MQSENLQFAVVVHPADFPPLFFRFFVMNIPTWFEKKINRRMATQGTVMVMGGLAHASEKSPAVLQLP